MIFEDIHLGSQEVNTAQINVAVFDIDGTLADLTHRRHYVRTKPKNWGAFEKAIPMDDPIPFVVKYLLDLHDEGKTIILASGRGEQSRDNTTQWLDRWTLPYTRLYMRAFKDYRADDIIKEELLDQMISDGYTPDIVFDDRDRVVDMWRRRGIKTIQVAEGNF